MISKSTPALLLFLSIFVICFMLLRSLYSNNWASNQNQKIELNYKLLLVNHGLGAKVKCATAEGDKYKDAKDRGAKNRGAKDRSAKGRSAKGRSAKAKDAT